MKENNNDFRMQSLDILVTFHNICEEHDLKYILDYGSLLGAIRHNGFIPWDDDIDVAMPQQDYEKFLKIAPSLFEKNIFIQENRYDAFYFNHFTKVRDTDVKINEEYLAHFDIKHGAWIDIFPYYPTLKDKNKEWNRIHEINKWFKIWALITPVIYPEDTKTLKNRMKNLVKRIVIKFLKKSQASSTQFLMKRIAKKFTEAHFLMSDAKDYEREEFDESILRTYPSMIQPDRDLAEISVKAIDFEERELHQFEGYDFYIPKRYDELLTGRYGEYMQLPPKDQQVTNHRLVKTSK